MTASLERIDARFLLPDEVRSATVLGELEGWRAGLAEIGIVPPGPGGTPDLVVAPAELAEQALAVGARSILVEGGDPRASLRRGGLAVARALAMGGVERPRALVPLGQPGPASFALTRWARAGGWRRRLRRRTAAALLARGRRPAGASLVTIASRSAREPAAVRAARSVGADPDGYFLAPGRVDVLSRNLFYLFSRGASAPAWVLKVSRLPGYEEPFERDARGLALADDAGEAVAARAPRLLGRISGVGVSGSVETAAPGTPLSAFLDGPASRREKVRALERVAAWTIDVARATATPPDRLGRERVRLAREVVPPWISAGAPADLVDRIPAVPAVLQHGDLVSPNVVVDGEGFSVVDWESARRDALPLWDPLYLLLESLARLDGARDGPQMERHVGALFRGELPSSPLLFAWTRRAAEASAVPADAVGPIWTACLLHHGRWNAIRAEEIRRAGIAPAFHDDYFERIVRAWLTDPALGTRWSRWRA